MPKIAYSEAEMNKAKEAELKEGICRRCVSSLHHGPVRGAARTAHLRVCDFYISSAYVHAIG